MGNTVSGFWKELQKKVFWSFSSSFSNILSQLVTGSKILFVGNPGTGKSTLLNSIVGKCEFKSGITFGAGLTQVLQPYVIDGVEFIDTPGLSDVKMRKKAAEEIERALTRNGDYYLFFVITLEAGRVRPDDLTTMKLVLDALCNVKDLSFGIIVNKVTKNMIQQLQNLENFKEMVANLNIGIPHSTMSIFFHPVEESANDSNNTLLPHNCNLENFIYNCTPVTIHSEQVDPLKIDLFEEFKKAMEEETEKLRKDNAKLVEDLARLEREHIEKMRVLEEQIKFLTSKMSEGEKAARPFILSKKQKMLDMTDKPNHDIHECVRMGIGQHWNTSEWQEIYRSVKNFIVEFDCSKYEGLTIDMVGALTYYTSNVKNYESLYSILNPLMSECSDLNSLDNWKGYLWYAFEAYKILPKYRGTTYRGIDRSPYNFQLYQPGFEVTYNCFTSSTINTQVISSFTKNNNSGTWMIFKNTYSGVELKGISLYPAEHEVLFFPGTVFKLECFVSNEMKALLGFNSRTIEVLEFKESICRI